MDRQREKYLIKRRANLTDRKKILSAIKNNVLEIVPDAVVLLFGSRARQDFQLDSDWDILILVKKLATQELKRQISDQLFYVGLDYEICINTLVINSEDWKEKFRYYPLHSEIEKDGMLL
jgi:uncharacterized protein